jgi:hypothetical protein
LEVMLAKDLQHGLAVAVPQVGHAVVQVLCHAGHMGLDRLDATQAVNHAEAML